LRLGAGLDYPWPAETFGRGETLRCSALAGLTLRVDALLPTSDHILTRAQPAVQEKN
jgi:hypothetical protein